jgi:hypothetical protein
MDPTSPAVHAVHAGHDEALIARLFGGDVSEAERARALALVSECPECESLLADFGAIAKATAALPVPPRPRDFSLTEADAARHRGKTRARSRVFRLGLRRSLGGSLAALGIFGLILAGTTSILGGAASTANGPYALSPGRLAGALPAASVSNFGPASAATAAPAATFESGAVNPNQPTSSAVPVVDMASSAASAPEASGPPNLAAASTLTAQGAIAVGSGSTKSTEAPGSSSSGVDARLVWLLGFAALFVVGLALAILPVRRRGRDRSARS